MNSNLKVKLIIFLISINSIAQYRIDKIDIIRDSYGVPHIFAPTDAEVAYGLAWAHSEDDFTTIQKSYLAGNSMLSYSEGNRGLGADFLSQFIGSDSFVSNHYETDISNKYKKILQAYSAGINSYAEKHPEQVLVKELFPITPIKMLKYAYLQLFISSEGDKWVNRIYNNSINYDHDIDEVPKGSNTFAFNSAKTIDGDTYLAINTHQPLDGPVSWYEVHLCSEEGTNILGALFPGSPNVLIGSNENLAWTHTVNHPDKTDVFALEMHPTKKFKYRVDDEYLDLTINKAKLRYKVLGVKINIFKKYYSSIYGPTLKNKNGYYSIRTPSLFEIRGLEQWWKMSKAKNFTEFYNILKMKALPGYNIGYADKNDTIFYISNGLIPKRKADFDWANVVPGNTKKTLWNKTYDVEELPQVIQPSSGFFYNSNHSPFKSSDKSNNPDEKMFSNKMGFEKFDNNRSIRLKEQIDSYDKISYDDFKKIKYDGRYPKPYQFNWMNIDRLDKINPDKYPEISTLIIRLQKWDRKTNVNSLGAGTFAVFYNELRKYYKILPVSENIETYWGTQLSTKVFPELYIIKALIDTKKYMLKNFNNINIKLGDYQKLVRGGKEIPIFGLPDVITAMHNSEYEKGMVKVVAGESYIELVRFTSDGVEIESIISYGNSDDPNSIHYSDQMEMYSSFKTKKMTLDKKIIYKQAKKIYNPK